MYPFKTITKAIAVVNGLNRRDKTYTIHIKNGSDQTVDSTIVVTSNLSIECYATSYGDRQGSAKITSTCTTGPILQVGDGTLVSTLTIDGVQDTKNTTTLSDDIWTGLQLYSERSSTGLSTRGVEIKEKGSFFMNGGSITSNSCNGTGAGVHISSNAYFILTGGSITENNSGTNQGGGIYVADGGDLLIKGGVIKGNTASAGAGIYVAGNISINGACYISGNTANSAQSNIYLPDNKLIKINGNIDGSTIGITTQTAPSIGINIRFTEGYAYGKKWSQNKIDNDTYNHPFKYFHSDKDGFSILTDPTQDNPATEDVDENTGDAFLGISGGTITQKPVPEETILFSFRHQGNTIEITITCSDVDWTGSNSENTHITLKNIGVEVPSAFWSCTNENNILTITPENTLPAGTYVIEIDVTYGGYVYTGSTTFTKNN